MFLYSVMLRGLQWSNGADANRNTALHAVCAVCIAINNQKLRYREEHSVSVSLVGVLYDISQEKICWWLINHFYEIGQKSYRIRRNNAK